jgi:hypothetical protein
LIQILPINRRQRAAQRFAAASAVPVNLVPAT